jgi:hypothetical protein
MRLLTGRTADYMSPDAFADNLAECAVKGWRSMVDRVLAAFFVEVKTSAADLTFDLSKIAPPSAKTSLQRIFAVLEKLAVTAKAERKAGDPWPVIIIDEANALMRWRDEDSLKALLAFFVRLTKQEQLAHVVLATSDTFFLQWLEKSA